MTAPKPARISYAQGFRLYPLSMAGHIAQGAGAAVAVMHGGIEGIVLGSTWTALYVAYQGLSVLRKSDSPGLDIADYLTGYGVGIAGCLAWGMV